MSDAPQTQIRQGERLQLRISAELLAAIDAWRMAQTVPPSRAEVIRRAVEVMIRPQCKNVAVKGS